MINEFNDPNLIDYPVAYCWRTYYEETFYGRYLPPLDPPEPQPAIEPYKVRGLTNKERDEINQLKLLTIHLQNTVYTLLDKKRKRYKYSK